MSLNLEKNRARMTVSVRGWNDVVIDSGEGETEEGSALEDFINDMEYDPEADPDFSMDDIPGYDPDDPNYDPDNPTYDPDNPGYDPDNPGYDPDNPSYDPDNPSYDPETGLPYDLTYDFGENFNWDALAEDLDINLDLDGNIDVDQMEILSEKITNLAHNEDAIYNYMADHDPSEGIPARIRVINPPDKLEYKNGDEIDFTGIIVAAYASLTTRTPFIMEGAAGPHHNQIPFDELTFPVTVAENGSDTSGEITFPEYKNSGTVTMKAYSDPHAVYQSLIKASGFQIVFTENTNTETVMGWELDSPDPEAGEVVYITLYPHSRNPNYYCLGITQIYKLPAVGEAVTLGSPLYTMRNGFIAYARIDGNTLTFYDWATWDIGHWGVSLFQGIKVSSEEKRFSVCGFNAEAGPDTVSIPVQWQTDYREEPYEASYEITL